MQPRTVATWEARGIDERAEEARLVEAAAAGDAAAFARLVEPHLAVLHRVAWRVCGDATLADDAVQETLLVALRRLRRYRPGTSLRGWLAAIAIRRAHTLRRAAERRRRREQLGPVVPPPPGPEGVAEAAALARALRAALDRMPPRRRAVMLLRFDAGLDHAEIARTLGIRPASVRAHVHQGIAALRAALAAQGWTEETAR